MLPDSENVNESPRVFGILPTYRRQALLADTLERTLQQSRALDCLVIVDNEASDETRRIVETFTERHPEVETIFLSSPDNLGSAGGWALGMEEALKSANGRDWILTLDDDDPPQRSTDLQHMFEFALEQQQQYPDLGAVGIVGARFNWSNGYLERLSDEELTGPVKVDYVGSGHMAMYSVKAMQDEGVFRAELFFGHTEIEYCLRLREAGYRVLANGDLWKQERCENGRIGIDVQPDRTCKIAWQKYYVTRNYIFTMRQNHRADLALKRAFIQTIAKPLYTLPRSPGLAVRGFRLGLKASWDGFRSHMGRTVDPATFSM